MALTSQPAVTPARSRRSPAAAIIAALSVVSDSAGTNTGIPACSPRAIASARSRLLAELGVEGQRLLDSQRNRSYLALGVPAQRLGRLEEALVTRFGAQPVDLTDVFLDLLSGADR